MNRRKKLEEKVDAKKKWEKKISQKIFSYNINQKAMSKVMQFFFLQIIVIQVDILFLVFVQSKCFIVYDLTNNNRISNSINS